MPFIQNTYWGSAAGEAAYFLWELLWDQHAFIFGLAYIGWKIFTQWQGGGMGAAMTHITDSLTAIKDSILPICKGLLIAFLLIMFVWVPYQRARDVETSHADQITKLKKEKDEEIYRLKDENEGKLQSFKREREEVSKDAKAEAMELAKDISGLKSKVEEQKRLIDELHGKLTGKANRKAIRQQLGSYVEEGEELKRRCLKKEDAELLAKDGDQWAWSVSSYLTAKLDSSYRVQFVNPPPPMPIGHDIPAKNDRLWGMLDAHVGVIRKFIAELKD